MRVLLVLLPFLIAMPRLPAAQPVPGAEWPRTTPQAAGWDAGLVEDAHTFAQRIGTAVLLVVQHGQIIDSYGDITNRLELHSMRKSLLSSLYGIAIAQGRIDPGATLAQLRIDDTPPALTDEEKQATVADLLAARSGVYHVAAYETEGERATRPPRGSHPHGTFYYYNNWDFNALGLIYEHAVQRSIFDALADQIARPLGMQDYRPSDGRYVRDADTAIPAYPLRMTARDLARFGLLYLHGGHWGDSAVVPAAWVADSTTPRSMTPIGSGYAYLWWTGWNGQGFAELASPPSAYWADGARGQFILVDPADDMVIVHQTNGTSVRRRQFGHIVWLLRRAAHAPDPGPDPAQP